MWLPKKLNPIMINGVDLQVLLKVITIEAKKD